MDVDTKADGTWVTAADREVGARLRAAIRDRFPDHAVLGEEDGRDGPADAPTWIIDPIDGTRTFVTGNPVLATLIAVCVDGGELACGVSAPALGPRWDGVAGGRLARRRSDRGSAGPAAGRAEVSFGDLDWFAARDRWGAVERLVEATLRHRGYGDFWAYCHVA